MTTPALVVALLMAFLLPAGAAAAESEAGLDVPSSSPFTERVSVSSGGTQASGQSSATAISANGRYVAFVSSAANLVAGDTNSAEDVFVRDTQTGTTERVSVATDGTQANGYSFVPVLSYDGRFVAFNSNASNLVADDNNGTYDVFVHDRDTGTTELVSASSDGTPAAGASYAPALSADGRYVAFSSEATLASDDTNGLLEDVYVRDRATGTTVLASVGSPEGGSYADISADGRYVTFNTLGLGVTPHVYIRDLVVGTTDTVSVDSNGVLGNNTSYAAAISANGRYVSFLSSSNNLVSGDSNARDDIFVHDTETGTTERVSVATDGTQSNHITGGRPDISADGRHVVFRSYATNLVEGDSNAHFDVFLRDTQAGTTERVSVASDGFQANSASGDQAISADGSRIAFTSAATNLVADDTNSYPDAFVRDRGGVLPTPTGQLRVTTSPAVPGQIVVDGVPRDSWGLNWVEFPVGSHEVCFGPVPGFTPPPCQDIEVVEDQTTTVDGAYAQRGTLQVVTSPAVPSTITIDGAPANDWGVWTDLDPGTYEVCFGAAADLAAPACEDAVVTAGATTTITGVFTSSPGTPGPSGHGFLRATADPAVGSRITVDGEVADSWGLTWLKLAPGDHEVCFEGVLYATAPACEQVEVLEGQTTTVEGAFVVHGFLRVLTSPAVGATITVDGEPANAWGVWTSLEPGTYEVCYGEIEGLTAPACEDAVVTAGATTEVTGTYT